MLEVAWGSRGIPAIASGYQASTTGTSSFLRSRGSLTLNNSKKLAARVFSSFLSPVCLRVSFFCLRVFFLSSLRRFHIVRFLDRGVSASGANHTSTIHETCRHHGRTSSPHPPICVFQASRDEEPCFVSAEKGPDGMRGVSPEKDTMRQPAAEVRRLCRAGDAL